MRILLPKRCHASDDEVRISTAVRRKAGALKNRHVDFRHVDIFIFCVSPSFLVGLSILLVV